jgi:Glyoxalase-like domain
VTLVAARPRLRLRQVALVATDLDAAEQAITADLGVELCFRDPGVGVFGLRNALYPIGHQLLEVVSPVEPGTTAGRYLERRGGDGGYMVILETDERLDRLRNRLTDLDVRVVFEAVVPGITGLHLHPRDVGGAILSIDRTDEWGEWPWAGPDWRRHVSTRMVAAIAVVDIAATDPPQMAARWAAVLDRPVAADGRSIVLDEGTLRFVPADPGRGEGVAGIELVAAPGVGRHAVTIAGCEVTIVAC